MSIPDSNLSWEGAYDYANNTLALTENDRDPSKPVDVRELFVQKISDVAKVDMQQCRIGGGLFHQRLEW